jgi:hypothetical protein
MILDHGRDATVVIHNGVDWEVAGVVTPGAG